jgi:hypothetical protein
VKTISFAVVVLVTFALNSYAFADYLIRLKNGRNIETPNCWEEKGEVKFQWQGGIASVPKKNILAIRQVEERFPERSTKEGKKVSIEKPRQPSSKAPKELPQPEMSKLDPADPVKKAAAPEILKASEIEYYKKQKAHYTEQYEQALQRYLDASSRKDVEGKKKAWEEFNRFGGQVITLETELKNRNYGAVPSWWKEEKTKEEK